MPARRRLSEVFVDLCTQRCYLSPSGIQPAANAALILPRLKHLMAFARWAKVPTLSCIDVCRCNGDGRLIQRLGPNAQRKIPFSLLPDHVVIDSDNRPCVALDVLQQHQQVIFTKQHRDPFTNPKLDRLLTEMPAGRFLVFGVGLETSIRLLVLGLLLRHRQVALVYDACGYWNPNEADMALRQLQAKGCEMETVEQVIRTRMAALRYRGRARLRQRPSVA